MGKKKFIIRFLIFLVLSILAFSYLYPLFFMFINSLKTNIQYMIDPFGISIKDISFENYKVMITQFKIFQIFKNTLIVTIGSLALLLFFGIFASYAFAKLKFIGKKKIYLGIMATMFIPTHVIMIPIYVMFSKVNLINNCWSVILLNLGRGLPGVILLLTSNFIGIPNEMLEAGKIDGCNYFKTIRNIVIPMGMPSISITVIFNFITFWNDLFTPMILLKGMDVRTIMPALTSLVGRYSTDVPFQFTGLMLSSIPAILLYILLQEKIVMGITMGSIK